MYPLDVDPANINHERDAEILNVRLMLLKNLMILLNLKFMTQDIAVLGLEGVLLRSGGIDHDPDWNWTDVLSPGEMQRIAFLRIFYHRPRVKLFSKFGPFLLESPFVSLGRRSRRSDFCPVRGHRNPPVPPLLGHGHDADQRRPSRESQTVPQKAVDHRTRRRWMASVGDFRKSITGTKVPVRAK